MRLGQGALPVSTFHQHERRDSTRVRKRTDFQAGIKQGVENLTDPNTGPNGESLCICVDFDGIKLAQIDFQPVLEGMNSSCVRVTSSSGKERDVVLCRKFYLH